MDGSAFFSNLSYRKDDTLRFGPPPPVWRAPGFITDWELSSAVKAALVEDDLPPLAQKLPGLTWQKVKADAEGRLDVSRFLGRQPGGPDTVFARTTLRADQDEVRRLRFGYSDTVTVFLNGKPISAGDSSYTLRDPSFLGIMGTFDTLFLPLRKGDNELLVTLSETMGGWGFVAQDAKAIFAAPGVSKLWKTPGFKVPESAAYDGTRKVLYVSNFDPMRPGGGQSISRVGLDGKVLDLDWVKGLRNPAGLKVQGDTLWAVEPRGLVEIDIPGATIRTRHEFPEAQMLNDVEVDPAGIVYVSDSRKGCVYRLAGGKSEVFLDGPAFVRPNGLLVQGGRLWVATNGDGTLKAVDLATKAVLKVIPVGKGIGDGLAADEAGNILMTHNEGRLLRISHHGTLTLLLDTSVPGQNLGDITYIPGKRMVVAPTFLDGGLVAYALPR
jgi:sugar lactone lactonase YvrE